MTHNPSSSSSSSDDDFLMSLDEEEDAITRAYINNNILITKLIRQHYNQVNVGVGCSVPGRAYINRDRVTNHGYVVLKAFNTLSSFNEVTQRFRMEDIKHKHVEVRGLKLHVAEIGSGPKVVLFLHGFPEIWYTWRHQMIAVANNGYRAIAFDFRGYGLSDQPAEPEKATFQDTLDDVVGLMDSLEIPKAFLVGKDFGALPAYLVASVYPERVIGVVTLGVPFMLPGPSCVQNHLLPSGFYITRWQEPGRAEADFGRFDVKSIVRNIYTLFSRSEIPIAGDDQEFMDLFDQSTPLPPWFSDEDLSIYASLYEKSGFTYALQVPYRSLTVDIGIADPKVSAPALFVMGESDYVLKFPGMEDFIKSGTVKNFVPDLEIKYIPEGSHFVQEQFPEKINQFLIDFLAKHSV